MLTERDESKRDRALVTAVCDTPGTRERIRELEITTPATFNKFVHRGEWYRDLKLKRSLPELLWLGYLKDPDYQPFTAWALRTGIDRPDIGPGYFWTAASIERAVTTGNLPPIPIESVEFARAIVLFAALLPISEATELFITAARLGCTPLRRDFDWKPKTESPAETSVSGNDEAAKEASPDIISPRLTLPDPNALNSARSIATSAGVDALILDLQSARDAERRALLAAKEMFSSRFDGIITGPDAEYDAGLNLIEAARHAYTTARDAQQRCAQKTIDLVSHAYKNLGLSPPEASFMQGSMDVAELGNNLRAAEGLFQLADNFDSSMPELADWRAKVVGFPTPQQLDSLASLRRIGDARREARCTFDKASNIYLRNVGSSVDVAEWLHTLSGDELSCLLANLNAKEWLVPAAILTRAGLDIAASAFASSVRSLLEAKVDPQERRALLRFCNSASSSLDREPAVRRIVVLERFHDIVHFGPIALLADPNLGLGDAALVGRTSGEIADLIVSHLELLGVGNDLRSLLAPRAGLEEAMRQLVSFATTPSTMEGNYRRLRERARIDLFLPLIKQGELDRTHSTRLSRQLSNLEDAIEHVVEEVQTDLGRLDKIEAPHRTQLDRYLRQGRDLLERVLAISSREPSQREEDFRVQLRRLLGKLRRNGTFGTVSWFESGVAEVLSGDGSSADFPTLVGDEEPIGTRAWTTQDTQWARTFLDLPEFYIEDRFATIEIAAAALRWHAKGRVPTLRDTVNQLILRRCFVSALSAIENSHATAQDKEQLKILVEEETSPLIEAVRLRLTELREKYGEATVDQSNLSAGIEAALAAFDPDEAADQLELLDAELSVALKRTISEVRNPAVKERRETLIRLLLTAGAAGVDDSSSLEDLEMRWSDELHRREKERVHLTTVEHAFRNVDDTLPVLSHEHTLFKDANLKADRWLSSSISETLSEVLREPAEKLGAWIASSSMFERDAREALIDLSIWFMRFVCVQTETLRSLGAGDSPDPVFDRVIDVLYCILRAQNSLSCIEYLREVDESVLQRSKESVEGEGVRDTSNVDTPAESEVIKPQIEISLSTLARTLESQDWTGVCEVCGSLRVDASDEDARMFDDVSEFAQTMSAIYRDSRNELTAEALTTAARLLGTAGQPVYRAFSTRQIMDFGFTLLVASLGLDQNEALSSLPRADSDGSWAPLLLRRQDFFRSLASGLLGARTARVMEQLCSGAVGADIAVKIWDSVTNMSEPGTMRAAFLGFLYDHSLFDSILRLSTRYEPSIRPRLEQLLELRNIATGRPDLVPVAHTLSGQVAEAAKPGPFRSFVRSLPAAAQAIAPSLAVQVEQDLVLRSEGAHTDNTEIPIAIEPRGFVPEKLEVALFPEDDATFQDGSRRKVLSDRPVYFPADYILTVRFGDSWTRSEPETHNDSLRLRVSARSLTGDLIKEDAVCSIVRRHRATTDLRTIDPETLLEFYPGVGNTPAEGSAFLGRDAEIERLHKILVASPTPSPVLLTGMRRIGKTSLLFAFHKRCRQPGQQDAVTIYLSVAERGAEFMDVNQDVGAVLFKAIAHSISKRNFAKADHNREVGERLLARLGSERMGVRKAIYECRDPESLADSLMLLGERLLKWLGSQSHRVVFLIDEAEALVRPFRAGGAKRLELEQLLQSLREVSQTSPYVGVVLSGSNHINEFAREYKNAFFGSCVRMELSGIGDFSAARRIVAPSRLAPFVQFDDNAVEYAVQLCAGMPQFMWQVGAATAFRVRSGRATRADVRRAVSAIVNDVSGELPFRPYDVLEPLEHMLSLQGHREPDLLWLLLWRIANASSLVAEQAYQHFVLDQTLMELDDRDRWKGRLLSLVELNVLEVPKPATYQFKVPIFAEGFRAARNVQENQVRYQRAVS